MTSADPTARVGCAGRPGRQRVLRRPQRPRTQRRGTVLLTHRQQRTQTPARPCRLPTAAATAQDEGRKARPKPMSCGGGNGRDRRSFQAADPNEQTRNTLTAHRRRRPARMQTIRNGLGALTLFVEGLGAVTTFYRDVLDLELVFEDDVSAVFDLSGTLLNVLAVSAAPDLVAPASTTPVGAAAQMLLSVWVDDVDAACAELQAHGVTMLNGPVDR